MEKTIFEKIIDKDLPSKIIDETDKWIAIYDIHPVTPVHVLIIPKKRGSLQDYSDEDKDILGELMIGVTKVATKLGLDKSGYRLVINYGNDSEAHVTDHMHIHMLGGKKLGSKIIN